MKPRSFISVCRATTEPLGRRHLFYKVILGAILGASCPHVSRATGGFEEEPLQTLPEYLRLDQLPAKSARQILAETSTETPQAEKIDYAKELMALTKKPGPQALAALERMVTAARLEGDSSLLNLLHDLHDLLAGPANAEETQAYVDWRIEQADSFGVVFEVKKPGPAEPQGAAPSAPNAELMADIGRHLAKASPALQPHWLYLRAAAAYLGHDIAESQNFFLKVVHDFPKSARAEAALYMAARCQMWKSRAPGYTQQDLQLVAAERPKAKKLWDEYFAKYPHGLHYGDALGWYGAYAFDGHDFGAALRCYAQQLELTEHPELTARAAEMVEKTLSHLASQPKDSAFAEVARHPGAAQALVYLVVNTSESDNYNGKFDPIEVVRGWRKNVLPRLAAAISAQAKLYQDSAWKPRYLAMLAYAASGAGQQEQALNLLQSAGATTEQSDDLLMARGVVLHRARQPGEAAKTLETLLAKFPKSPLAPGARLRLGLALTDDHRGGEAVVALQKLLPPPADPAAPPAAAEATSNKEGDQEADEPPADDYESTGESPLLYGIDQRQILALIDTLLNFAPVEELAATAQKPGLDPLLRLELTEPIAQRLLAREQFEEARKFLTPAQYGLVAAHLEQLTTAARTAKDPAAHAAACLQLGDAWAAARGKLLTYPLDTGERREKIYISFAASANIRRADSAPFLGAAGNYKLDLENRDELRHAFNWWLEASDAQAGTPQAAPALWRALKAMPSIADVSPYTVQRAAARKWSEVARKLSDRLHSECPDSVEARRYAVTWDFMPVKKSEANEDGSLSRSVALAGISGAEAFGLNEDSNETRPTDALLAKIGSLEKGAGAPDAAKARAAAEALRGEARRVFPDPYDARWVNLVDDLALFLSEPDPGAATRKRYAELRFRLANHSAIGGSGYADESDGKDPDEPLLADINTALADPAAQPVADYFAFLKLAVAANHFVFVKLKQPEKPEEDLTKEEDTYRTRAYPQLARDTEAFLDKYPRSKKREAALLLHARAVYRSSEAVAVPRTVSWPRASRWEGGSEPTLTQQEPFDPRRVLAALDAYDLAYPHGRYAADIRLYRAAVACRQQDWKAALELTLAQLTGKDSPGLQREAADRLGTIFAQLADERYRADLLTAIKASKSARQMLEKYLAVEADSHPLLYLKSWVRQQLAAK